MSIRAWGIICINEKLVDERNLDDLSFNIVDFATRNHIGIKLGENIKEEFLQEFTEGDKNIPFELVDNPRSNVAEVLFLGQGITLKVKEKTINTTESLDSRVFRVQTFFEQIFSLCYIVKIILHIIGGFGSESVYKIKLCDFRSKLVELFYNEKDNWTPSVKLIIKK